MRVILIVLLVVGFANVLNAQQTPRFTKMPIGNSGAYAYMPAKGDPAEFSYSQDSSKVFTMNASFDDYLYDVIYIEFAQAFETDEQVDAVLVSYLDYLKTVLKTTSCAGYGKGHILSTHKQAQGVKDYCKDDEGSELQLMGWADKHYLAVLVITGDKQYPNQSVVDMFLNGIRFPGD
ncbi:MAG: hypothetical protein U0V74_00690 [Chitinophagales bacterium]